MEAGSFLKGNGGRVDLGEMGVGWELEGMEGGELVKIYWMREEYIFQ